MKRIKRLLCGALALVFSALLFAACGAAETLEIADDAAATAGQGAAEQAEPMVLSQYAQAGSESEEMHLDVSVLSTEPAIPNSLMPTADGETVYGNNYAEIDASNIDQGYVMVRYLGSSTQRVRFLVHGPSYNSGKTADYYKYDINTNGEYEVIPISDGNGSYRLGVYQLISGKSYATLYSKDVNVELADEFAPFLLPNQYVNYSAESLCVKEAALLVKGKSDVLSKIGAMYDYVIGNFTYDYEQAKTVQSGYLPVLDTVWEKKTGICFDYAATLTAMLRSQGIPAKLVIGYSGTAYHAWISAWSEATGWMDGVIFFDGKQWKLMDPTFASSADSSAEILSYIGDASNYTARYVY